MTEQEPISHTIGRYKTESYGAGKISDREQRGLAIAALFRIDKKDGKYVVPSQSGNGERYEVAIDKEYPTCTCRDYQDRAIKCKHMFAVEFALRREYAADGSVTFEKSITIKERVTYKQDWPAYNKAQTNEKRRLTFPTNRGEGHPEEVAEGQRRLADGVLSNYRLT